MLPLLERLRITLLEKESQEHRADRERVYSACANQLCFHVTDIISGTREIELELMSTRTYDPLVNIVGALQRAQYRYGTDDLEFAIERAEEVIRVRGRRLQLEGSGIPTLQFGVLRILSVLIVMSYTYLTLDRPEVTASVLGKARLFTEMQVLNHAVTTATPATTCVELNQCVGCTPSSRRRGDGVEVDTAAGHEGLGEGLAVGAPARVLRLIGVVSR